MPAAWVADSSAVHPSVAELRAAGAVGIVRYMDPGRNDRTEITAAEIADYHANNFPYGLVMEYSADWIEGGYDVGFDKARQALADEAALGIPKGVTYAAVDFDIQPFQFQQALNTLRGMADGYGGWQYLGVYGSKSFCEWVGASSTVKHFWSTDAWSNYTPATNAALHQHANWPANVPVVQGCDHNLILGDWAPRNGSTDWFDMATQADLEATLRKVLNEGTAAGQPSWAGTNKALLATLQGVVNTLNIIAKSQSVVLVGGASNVGLKQINEAVAALQVAMEAIPAGSGGSVDPGPIVDGVVSGVKAQFAKAAQ